MKIDDNQNWFINKRPTKYKIAGLVISLLGIYLIHTKRDSVIGLIVAMLGFYVAWYFRRSDTK